MDSKGQHFGYSMSVDAFGCEPVLLGSVELMAKFVRSLVSGIGMRVFRGHNLRFSIEKYGDSPDNYGITALCPLWESSITAHCVEAKSELHIDIFSCKHFSEDVVEMFVKDAFEPDRIKCYFRER